MRSTRALEAAVAVAPGRPAIEALGVAITAAKGDDAFAAVTVLVPSRRSALSLRRELSASPADAAAEVGFGGLVNVRFEIAARIAELIAAPALARSGRRPATAAVIREATRSDLLANPGVFVRAASHPATMDQVSAAYEELRWATLPVHAALSATNGRAADLVARVARIRSALRGWYDEVDLVEQAAALLQADGEEAADLGHVIAFVPHPTDYPTAALIGALGTRATVIEIADPTPAELVSAGTDVLSVSDPDEEARAATRAVLALAEAGTPLHRTAIAHPGGRYGVLLHQHLAQAGVPHHGPAVRTLADTVGGRTLLGLVALAEGDLTRDDVISWLSASPIVDPASGALVPAARWDAVSAKAGVVGGRDQWQTRTARHAERMLAKLSPTASGDDDPGNAHDAAHHEDAARLAAFVSSLCTCIEAAQTKPWAAWAEWIERALVTYLGSSKWREHWPAEEADAFDQLVAVIKGLVVLDSLGSPPDLATVGAVLAAELDVPVGRLGTFGDGVYVGSIRSVRGLAVDAVVVVGLAEGMVPHRPHRDPLVGDAARAAAGLMRPGDAIAVQRSDLFVALGSASHRTVLVPRGDLRSNRTFLPSRWAVEIVEASVGHPITADQFHSMTNGGAGPVHKIASFADGLSQGTTTPLSRAERQLQSLWVERERGGSVTRSAAVRADAALASALRAEVARTTEGFTVFDGKVDPSSAPALSDRPLSPTSLQRYATCPRQYFFSNILGLQPIEQPDDITQIKPMVRGTLVHRILERWIDERIASGDTNVDHDRLYALAEEEFDSLEALGLTGRALRWAYDKEQIRGDLAVVANSASGTPVAVEMAFGQDGEPPVIVTLPTGGAVSFKGTIDRVDRMADGSLSVVDYKTGSNYGYTTVEATTVDRGEKLQLPLYAMGARQRFGSRDLPVRAFYWFISRAGGFKRYGYEVTKERVGVLADTLDVLVDGIRSGRFPANPGEIETRYNTNANCTYCDFDSVCPTDRGPQWERTRSASELTTYVTLREGPAESGEAR
ncbi:MAG: PD-(D/E)XK nuclease family protein [Acidimicrobiales bacterium]